MLLVNLYAPNGPKTEFFKKLNKKLTKYNYEHIVMVGDFNGTVCNAIDRTKPVTSKTQKIKGRRIAKSLL